MTSPIAHALTRLSECNQNQIEIGPHAKDRMEDRNINENLIYDYLVKKKMFLEFFNREKKQI